jgi:hypothetical protein
MYVPDCMWTRTGHVGVYCEIDYDRGFFVTQHFGCLDAPEFLATGCSKPITSKVDGKLMRVSTTGMEPRGGGA